MSNLEKLLLNLQEGDLDLKKLSIQALVKSSVDENVIQALERVASTDSSEDIRYFARKALDHIRKQSQASGGTRPDAGVTPGNFEETGEIEAMLSSKDPKVRLEALQAVGKGGLKQFVPHLTRILQSKEHPVILAMTAKILGHIAGAVSIGLLSGLLDHEDPRVRANAVEGLGLTRSASAVPAIMQALRDTDNRVKANALTLLGKIGSVNVARILKEMLVSQKISHRESAVWAAGSLKGREITTALIEALMAGPGEETELKILESLSKREPAEFLPGLEKFSRKPLQAGSRRVLQALLSGLPGRLDELSSEYVKNILKRIQEPVAATQRGVSTMTPVKSSTAAPKHVGLGISAEQRISGQSPGEAADVVPFEQEPERKTRALAAMMLIPMGQPHKEEKLKRTHIWQDLERMLGKPIAPDGLPEDTRQDLAEYINTIEVWRNNGYNVEPLYRFLGLDKEILEEVFDKYACLIQRCNKLATRFKRLDVSMFKDETVDISLNLKNPCLVETIEEKICELENRVREIKSEFQDKLEKFKGEGFDVKNLEISMIENLKSINEEFTLFEKRVGGLFSLKEEMRPYRCKALAVRIKEIDEMFSTPSMATAIKEEISKLARDFDDRIKRSESELSRWEKYNMDTTKLRRAIEKRDMDLIELQIGSFQESLRIIEEVENKFKSLDHEIFSVKLGELRKKIKNPATIKEVNYDLTELLNRQEEEKGSLRVLAEKWGQSGYDVSLLHASVGESLTWSRQIFLDFKKENSLPEQLPFEAEELEVDDILALAPAPPREKPSESTLSKNGLPPIEWWNLDFGILKEYDDGSGELIVEIDAETVSGSDEDIHVSRAMEAAGDTAAQMESLSPEELENQRTRTVESFEKMRTETTGDFAAAEEGVFGRPPASDEEFVEIVSLAGDRTDSIEEEIETIVDEQMESFPEDQAPVQEVAEESVKVRQPLSMLTLTILGVTGIVFLIVTSLAGVRFYRSKFSPGFHTDTGNVLLAAKDYKGALQSYETALSIDPFHEAATLQLIDALVSVGTDNMEMLQDREGYLKKADEDIRKRLKSAIGDFKRELQKKFGELNKKLAELYIEITVKRNLSFQNKVDLLNKALSLDSKGPGAQEIECQLAELNYGNNKIDESIRILEGLKKKKSIIKKIPTLLGKAYFSKAKTLEDPAAKVELLEKAVALDPEPKYKTTLQNLYKNVAQTTSDIDEKIRILKSALNLDDGNVLMRNNLVELLREKIRITPDIDMKLDCYRALEKYDPEEKRYFLEIVRLTYEKALKTSDPLARLDLLEFVRNKTPENNEILKNHIKNTFIEIGDKQDEFDAREKWYRRAYEITPGDASIKKRLSRVYLLRGNSEGKFSGKELNYKNAMEYDPDSNEVRLIYASLYYNRGVTSTETKEKIYYYEQSAAIDKDFLEVYNNLALDYGKSGPNQNERSMFEYLKRAYKLDPASEIPRHNLALFFYNHGVRAKDKSKKIAFYKKASEIDDTLEAAKENHRLLTTNIFNEVDEMGNVVLRSASQVKIREMAEVDDFRYYPAIDLQNLIERLMGPAGKVQLKPVDSADGQGDSGTPGKGAETDKTGETEVDTGEETSESGDESESSSTEFDFDRN